MDQPSSTVCVRGGTCLKRSHERREPVRRWIAAWRLSAARRNN
ncbi:hypothetical protein RB8534 [Rhodopirellula baltica SH 1]|uniref:Uncharacterized protein n=1 Tax=Rhodopirellula baltica (strain DSM 10527 / NCIMB 13988 / SH1) TaxID=243090 RepID=Q7UFI6_RHOBA|nr:hypothetical protein RB8534 [Rhodopirellula baltica SH 1]